MYSAMYVCDAADCFREKVVRYRHTCHVGLFSNSISRAKESRSHCVVNSTHAPRAICVR